MTLTAPQGDSDPLAPAFRRGKTIKAALLQMEGGALAEMEFASRLGIPVGALTRKVEAGEVLAVESDGRRLYPAFQIVEGGLLPGLGPVLDALEFSDPWWQLNFLLTGDSRLGGRRPLDVLRGGDMEPVLRAARAYGEQGG